MCFVKNKKIITYSMIKFKKKIINKYCISGISGPIPTGLAKDLGMIDKREKNDNIKQISALLTFAFMNFLCKVKIFFIIVLLPGCP